MDFKFSLGFSFLLFTTFYISKVSCLLCYVCSTKNPDQKDCLDIPEGSVKYLENCIAPKNISCRLQTQWIDFELSEESRDKHVIRQCASSDHDVENRCFYRTGYLGRMSICSCIGDGCNTAIKSVSTSVFKVLLVCLSVLLLS